MSVFLMLTALTSCAAQEPTPGISQALARARRQDVSAVVYDVHFDLVEGADHADGVIEIHFALTPAAAEAKAVVLDFGGPKIDDIRINGIVETTGVQHLYDHLLVRSNSLLKGDNVITARFTAEIAATGTPLTVFRDAARNQEFLYTLVVPADAHRLFPCFDQPDIKAVFRLALTVPPSWSVVSNGATKSDTETRADGHVRYAFDDTEPISTYLMAFAAGPFAVLADESGSPGAPLRMFVRASKVAEVEQGRLFEMHRQSLARLGQLFGVAYPFGKLDIVLLPGFPYGGMEHAGAIFYRETALVFDHSPTESELIRRSTLIYHEVSHQWFGNLVTMEWFDDLWLKEGFATFIAYHLLATLEPDKNAWLRFLQNVKPRAYRVDATNGTTPVYQELDNLADAKSAYGAIVYNKAPAVLRELHARLQPEPFRRGLTQYLHEHSFENARWQDLLTALEAATDQKLETWSKMWILTAGMPRVRARWRANADGTIREFAIDQEGIQQPSATWPLHVELTLLRQDGNETLMVTTEKQSLSIDKLIGQPAPLAVLLNPNDVAYGEFLLDPVSREYLLNAVTEMPGGVQRARAVSSLFDSVREAELEPDRYAGMTIDLLQRERDPANQAWLLGTLATTLRRYLPDDERRRQTESVAAMLHRQLAAGCPGRELQTFRFLATTSADDATLDLCEALLAGETPVPGLTLGTQDKYLALAAMLAAGRAAGLQVTMTGNNTPANATKYAFLALAAVPDAATKKHYFETYLQPAEPPEQWMQDSLAYFHWPGQEALTLPYLRRALEQMQWVKTHRKIFFMPAWIDAFVNAHNSPEALAVVEEFVAKPDLPGDIRRKLLQSADGLRRAVAVRAHWR